MKVKYTQLPVVGLKIEYLVQVVEPVECMPIIYAYGIIESMKTKPMEILLSELSMNYRVKEEDIKLVECELKLEVKNETL